jgi:hypothetical protein
MEEDIMEEELMEQELMEEEIVEERWISMVFLPHPRYRVTSGP